MDQQDDKQGKDVDQGARYKDDAPELVESSDYAQGNQVGQYSGGGPDTSTEPAPRPKGSQDWQQGITAANDPSDKTPTSTADDPDNDVHSRSADPGQSSYGGFKNEGPAEHASHTTSKEADRHKP